MFDKELEESKNNIIEILQNKLTLSKIIEIRKNIDLIEGWLKSTTYCDGNDIIYKLSIFRNGGEGG